MEGGQGRSKRIQRKSWQEKDRERDLCGGVHVRGWGERGCKWGKARQEVNKRKAVKQGETRCSLKRKRRYVSHTVTLFSVAVNCLSTDWCHCRGHFLLLNPCKLVELARKRRSTHVDNNLLTAVPSACAQLIHNWKYFKHEACKHNHIFEISETKSVCVCMQACMCVCVQRKTERRQHKVLNCLWIKILKRAGLFGESCNQSLNIKFNTSFSVRHYHNWNIARHKIEKQIHVVLTKVSSLSLRE